MICPPCKEAADSADANAPHICRDPTTCSCAHKPSETNREDNTS